MSSPRPRQNLATGVALAVTMAVPMLLGACRSKAGDPCRCASDCGVGLECYAEGEKILMGDACFKPGVIGQCIVAESVETDSAGEPLSDMPIRDDLPSKRDLAGPGSNSLSDSNSGPTEGTTASSMTGTTTMGTTDGTATDGTATDTTTTSTTTSTSTTEDTTTTSSTSTTDSTTTTTTGTSTDSTSTTSTSSSTSSTGSSTSESTSG